MHALQELGTFTGASSLFLRLRTDLYSESRKRLRVLHVAREASLRAEILRLGGIDYVTGDLLVGNVDVRLDLTDIDFPDASFDVIPLLARLGAHTGRSEGYDGDPQGSAR